MKEIDGSRARQMPAEKIWGRGGKIKGGRGGEYKKGALWDRSGGRGKIGSFNMGGPLDKDQQGMEGGQR